MIPEMKAVDSSNVAKIGYHADSRTLHVLFKSGGHYTYADVPPELHKNLMDAPSKTNFLRSMVFGKHTHTKVNADAG